MRCAYQILQFLKNLKFVHITAKFFIANFVLKTGFF